MVMYRLRAAALVLVVLLAGCTAVQDGSDDQSTAETPDDGLTLEFSPLKSSFAENEVMQFRIRAANTGGADATNIEARTFGSPFVDDGGDQGNGRCPAKLTVENDNNGVIPSKLGADAPPVLRDQWTCAPAGASPGYGSDTVTVDTEGIQLSPGSSDSFDAGIEIAYNYSTTAQAEVTIATPSLITSPSTVATSNSNAPVKAEIELQSPQPERQNGVLEVPVTVRNVGSGELVGVDRFEDDGFDGNEVNVTVRGPSREGGGRYTATRTIDLVDGRRQVVLPVDGFTLPDNVDEVEQPYPVEVALQYRYRERVSSSFSITGQPDGVTMEQLGEARIPDRGQDDDEPGDDDEREEQTEAEGTNFVVTRERDAGKSYSLTVERPWLIPREDTTVQVAVLTADGNANAQGWRACEPMDDAGDGNPAFPCSVDGLEIKENQRYRVRVEDGNNTFRQNTHRFNSESGDNQGRSDADTPIDAYIVSADDEPEDGTFTVEVAARLPRDAGSAKMTTASISPSGDDRFSACEPVAELRIDQGQEVTTDVGQEMAYVENGRFQDGNQPPLVTVNGYACGGALFDCESVDDIDGTYDDTVTCYKGEVPYRARVSHDGNPLSDTGRVTLVEVETGDEEGDPTRRTVVDAARMPATFDFGGSFNKAELPYVGDTVEFSVGGIAGCQTGAVDPIVYTIGEASPQDGSDTVGLSCGTVFNLVSPTQPVPIGSRSVTVEVSASHPAKDVSEVTFDVIEVRGGGEQVSLLDEPKTCDGSSCTFEFESSNEYAGDNLYMEVAAVADGERATQVFSLDFG